MLRGEQRRIITPGKNKKFYIAGALDVRTGRLHTTGAEQKNAAGEVVPNVSLPAGTGASKQMWSYLADLAKVQTNPFGPNPHALVL